METTIVYWGYMVMSIRFTQLPGRSLNHLVTDHTNRKAFAGTSWPRAPLYQEMYTESKSAQISLISFL